jgi:hypothetical protein
MKTSSGVGISTEQNNSHRGHGRPSQSFRVRKPNRNFHNGLTFFDATVDIMTALVFHVAIFFGQLTGCQYFCSIFVTGRYTMHTMVINLDWVI